MLLTLQQCEKLKYIVPDKSGKAEWYYDDKNQATREELEYAIGFDEVYRSIGIPFISNIEDLKKRMDEIKKGI